MNDATPDDGGIVVSLLNTGRVRIGDEGGAWDMDAFRAIDVGQRLIQMGTLALQRRMMAESGIRATHTPKIDVIRGVSLPTMKRGE